MSLRASPTAPGSRMTQVLWNRSNGPSSVPSLKNWLCRSELCSPSFWGRFPVPEGAGAQVEQVAVDVDLSDLAAGEAHRGQALADDVAIGLRVDGPLIVGLDRGAVLVDVVNPGAGHDQAVIVDVVDP